MTFMILDNFVSGLLGGEPLKPDQIKRPDDDQDVLQT